MTSEGPLEGRGEIAGGHHNAKSMRSESDATEGFELLLSTQHPYGPAIEFRASGDGVLAVSRDKNESPSEETSTFSTLEEAVAALRALALDPDWETLEVLVSPAAGLSVDDLLPLVIASSADFAPRDDPHVLFEPSLVVNDRDFFAISYADGTWKLVEIADDYSTLAYVSLFEAASRALGSYTLSIGRLPTGDIIELVNSDGDGSEYAMASADKVSDVEAVREWIPGTEDWVEPLFIAAYRDARKIDVGSDFDPEWSDTLEISHELNLTEAEKQQLWALLDET